MRLFATLNALPNISPPSSVINESYSRIQSAISFDNCSFTLSAHLFISF